MNIVPRAMADGFTGATERANTVPAEGMPVVQVVGVPDGASSVGDTRAAVVALKSRTSPVDGGVAVACSAVVVSGPRCTEDRFQILFDVRFNHDRRNGIRPSYVSPSA